MMNAANRLMSNHMIEHITKRTYQDGPSLKVVLRGELQFPAVDLDGSDCAEVARAETSVWV